MQNSITQTAGHLLRYSKIFSIFLHSRQCLIISVILLAEYNAYFGGSSHLLFNIGGITGRSKMEIALKPDAKDGLLLYIGARNDGRGDYASLAIINGFVDFRYYCKFQSSFNFQFHLNSKF